jgi:hypothetical protein
MYFGMISSYQTWIRLLPFQQKQRHESSPVIATSKVVSSNDAALHAQSSAHRWSKTVIG